MTHALEIENLQKTYASGVVALSDINLTVEPGDFYAVLGPNGAGKSTTIGVLCSLIRKTAGTVKIFGHDIDVDFDTAKMLIGVVPQEFNFNQFERVQDIVITQGGYYGLEREVAVERAEKYLRRLGLWDKRLARSRELSGGMKRRLMIARALVHEPRLLILDEPTAGVDIELRRSMWKFLREINEQGITIILTTHYLEEAESLCRKVAIIDNGRIKVDTTVRELIAQLNTETFVLDTKEEIDTLPAHPVYALQRTDAHSLEVTVQRRQSLNDLFGILSAQGLNVVSLRNKANRLEELFIHLVEKKLEE